jgi:hypothetical protein
MLRTEAKQNKGRLIKLGIAEQEDTEDYAMSKYEYIKIYNSGNLKMSYSRGQRWIRQA